MKQTIIYTLLLIILVSSCRKSNYELPKDAEIISDSGLGIGTVTWTSDMDILIEGFVFVNDGQVLTIEPGTVIRFKEGQGATSSALIIARGGKILANGTQENPIIFTAESDPLDNSLPNDTTGLWGGIIILGQAPVNYQSGSTFIEGIPISEPRGEYGGDISEDNSGEFSYVSIRYPGTFLHEGNEINGLTLGGVGSKTNIHHVEIINSADDGIEIFGGSVNLSNLVIYNSADDAIDYDCGYNGNIQLALAIANNFIFDNFIEGSGALEPLNDINISNPTLANCTMISNTTAGNCILINHYSAGTIVNSIFTDIKNGVRIDYNGSGNDSYTQWKNNKLILENNLFYNVANNISDSIFSIYNNTATQSIAAEFASYFSSGNNEIINTGISFEGNFIPNIQTNENLYKTPSWFETTNYKGAFGTYDWTNGWTCYKNMY